MEALPDRLERQLRFVLEIDALKEVKRRSYRLGSGERENTAEHSWHLIMMGLVLSEHANEAVDSLRVLSMLAVHDLVEIDAGDTFVYHADAGQAERETRAADRIFGLLPEDQARRLRGLWEEFEAGETAEARFARTLDRLMPLLHNFHTEGRSWREHGVTADQVRSLNQMMSHASAPLADYAFDLIDRAVRRGYLPERR